MSDIKYSFTQHTPGAGEHFLEALFEYLATKNLTPSDPNILPPAFLLGYDIFPLGTESVVCPKCRETLWSSHSLKGEARKESTHPSRHTPMRCEKCGQLLDTTLSTKGAEAIIKWSSDQVRDGRRLTNDDWLELWMSVEYLSPTDPLWDNVGYVVMYEGNAEKHRDR